jgi:hypothetical protein
MTKTRKHQFINTGRIESTIVESNEEVQREFAEAAHLGLAGQQQLIDKLREQHSTSPELSIGALDTSWEDADADEESASGENLTPDQNNVEALAKALGLTYQDNEPLQTSERIQDRDLSRWELDPASSEGFQERMRHEGEYEEQ